MTNKEFINQLAIAAKKYYTTYKILPSMTISQAILESNWNKSGLAKDCFNFFGMKWTSSCGCDYKEYKTKEQDSKGNEYTLLAKFRKYKSLADGIKGYYDFLNYTRYKNLQGITDYRESCKLIREDGWATDLSYTTKLVGIVEINKLWKYDIDTIIPDEPGIMINKESDFINIIWLQYKLNTCLKGVKGFSNLVIDGEYGNKTKDAVLTYWKLLEWNKDGKDSGWNVGTGTRHALANDRNK
jgi:hypothetical protein